MTVSRRWCWRPAMPAPIMRHSSRPGSRPARCLSSRGRSSMRAGASDTASFRLAFAADRARRRSLPLYLPAAQCAEGRPQRAAGAMPMARRASPGSSIAASEPAADLADLLHDWRGRTRPMPARSRVEIGLPNATVTVDDARCDRSRARRRDRGNFVTAAGRASSSASPSCRRPRRASIRSDRLCQAPKPPGRAAGGRAGRFLRIRGFEMSKPNVAVRVGKRHLRQCRAAGADRRAVPAGIAPACFRHGRRAEGDHRQAWHRPRLQDQLRQGQPHLAVRQARRRPRRGAAGLRRPAQGVRPAAADRRPYRGAVRRSSQASSTSCRSRPSSAARPIC